MRESRRLPESELDIMLVVWKEGGAATAPAILTGLERPLTASALHSYLKRLEEKREEWRFFTEKVNGVVYGDAPALA